MTKRFFGFANLCLYLCLCLAQSARADLVFYMADGNHGTENHLIKYHSGSGFSSKPILDAQGNAYGWPSDLERVGSQVYGIDTHARILFTIDLDQALISPVGSPVGNGSMSSLAYDPYSDTLYMTAFNQTNVFSLDRSTGQQTYLFKNAALENVRAIAFNLADSLLYAYSAATGNLMTVDPVSKAVATLYNMYDGTGAFFDELTFHEGELYGSWVNGSGLDQTTAQLRRIDLATGNMTNIGPLVTDVSAHSLFIVSVPEPSMVPVFLALTGIVAGRRRIVGWFRSERSGD
jgi:hypothetical protein